MADQLSGRLFDDGPAPFLQVPNLRRLGEDATHFRNCYCASPLCAPSRASFMTGLLPSRTGVFDNAAEFASSIPTFAHHLRAAGYRTVLSGKMHFVGPDQLHGFEERLTTDVYPADFGWTPDWTRPGERIDWWYHNLGSVTDAGTAEITNQLEFDDEVAYHARLRLYQLARQADDRPFCLTVSFTHPHDPYVARRRFWDLYPDPPMPDVAAIAPAAMDPHSRRLYEANDSERFTVTDENVRDSRRAYFANISYLDAKLGELTEVLQGCGLADDTIVLFVSDHGDMLGERGMWFKMSFFEGSARVPLIVRAPGRLAPGRVDRPVSTMDVMPSLLELAGIDPSGLEIDGRSLLDADPGRVVVSQYMAEGSVTPMLMLRDERHKLCLCPADPPMAFDMIDDPNELQPLPTVPASLQNYADSQFDLATIDRQVRQSQASRLVVYPALRNGHYFPWDHQPLQLASERYMRNHMDLNVLEAQARFPRHG